MGYYTKKNHKYISREWVHGKWKYFYGKAKSTVGAGYKKEAAELREKSDSAKHISEYYKKEADEQEKWGPNPYIDNPSDKAYKWAKDAEHYGRKSTEAQNIYDKSLIGKTEKTASKAKATAQKGANKLKSFLSSTEKAYVTDSKGHKRDVNPNDPLYKAIEEAGKKKKKR